MAFRKFQAEKIFTGYAMAEAGTVLVTDTMGRVESLLPPGEGGDGIEYLQGILSPGFINCHGHLELSHLKGLIPEKTGLVDFVFTVVTQRHFPEEEILEAVSRGEKEMSETGTVAAGDICNNSVTLPQKMQRHLFYRNFVEVSGWLPQVAQTRFDRSLAFFEEFNRVLPVSMAPHAPYSLSQELWKLIAPYFENRVTTMHNQETLGEEEFFKQGTGDLTRMYEKMNLDYRFFQPPGKSSLQSTINNLEEAKNLLLVHNTFLQEEDLVFLEQQKNLPSIFFCLCANANLYIENTLPPVELLRRKKKQIVLGTDSLASNHSLNLLDEIKTITKHFPAIDQTEILTWATLNGARALDFSETLGSFEKGKTPGVIVIENLEEGRIGDRAGVRRLV